MQSQTIHLQHPWKKNSHKPNLIVFPNLKFHKPKTQTFSHSLKTTYEENRPFEHLLMVIEKGGKSSKLLWNGTQYEVVSINEDVSNQFWEFFIPSGVKENYIEYVKWKFVSRVFSSALQVLATQAMFRAMGVGYTRSLPSAAALNWVLKDGLGRLSRCIYTATLASAFDTNLKRVRFSTSIVFSLSIGIELLTPFFPRYFLLLATVANIAKQISLACYLATGSAVHRSFAEKDNLGALSAKSQTQSVCFDGLGLVLATLLNILCKNNQRQLTSLRTKVEAYLWYDIIVSCLPLVIYPVFSAIDLFGIYQGLKHVHLQTLTKDRLLIILDTWIQWESVPSPADVSKKEGIDFPWCKGRKQWPIRIGCVDPKDPLPKFSMLTMCSLRSEDPYFICMETARDLQKGVLLSFREGADTTDIIMGLLQACHIRKTLLLRRKNWEQTQEADDISDSAVSEWLDLVVDSSKRCAGWKGNLLKKLESAGWALKNILLSVHEQVRYRLLDEQ
ncbi:hypothetical protein IFM89_011919 [Coptis chinensis]|uniref:Protein root UVB sensitive 4 n=1 Tax=Coptis chinensis TaxID=261450 RepID=A0A835I053_9MAGN|nr:hypothetical protein IFM89_011919 [Coptis chinensis]